MIRTIDIKKNIIVFLSILIFVFGSVVNYGLIPHTSGGIGVSPNLIQPKNLVDPYKIIDEFALDLTNQSLTSPVIGLEQLLTKVVDGDQGKIRGVYSDGVLALPVVQQPTGDAGFVSTINGVATQFAMPAKYGVIGLLAHNYLSGNQFFELQVGDEVQIVYGDGEIETFIIADIQSYQALEPNSSTSQFLDLESGQELSATQLFKRVYFGNGHLTLQTCIQQGSVDSWGRLFIIAYPI